MDEEELRALGDIRNMKSQVEMLKIEFREYFINFQIFFESFRE